ncbi:hypothetical protein SAMN06296273_1196 [Nitrosomonas ureae]|uniref:Uncharacterized protein n=1 Tax=Nitrosomonas ureae TaxID=44577 RepID=A0A285BWZ0_9PROT|nr:hypothetical protein [Nitrosomonas ureae]SNX59762.1 hypothetical protein SAMN06296273_1196 [Nitrosomonas ureae]
MTNYTTANSSMFKPSLPSRNNELNALRKKNNPQDEPVGHFTGRCAHCGSNDLWDDNLAYGCNSCGAFLAGN